MFADWIWTSWEQAGLVALSAVLMLAIVIAVIRVVGLRSLSKMSSFDFAVTVAIGSVLASTVATSTPVANGAVAVAALLAVQSTIAVLRRYAGFGQVVDNRPVLLMRDGQFLSDALDRSRVTRSDVMAKLREANVLRLRDVRAVVLETTGDISVLHGDEPVEPCLLDGVEDDRRDAPSSRRA
ncbi:MAG: YetF domain-containing protein [Ilumatobacter sp.]|uniref:DUF421 domain-containing protein n=1 Tax=Ilumatobacter sp. TaxID=1967498 RepID=UPI0032973725